MLQRRIDSRARARASQAQGFLGNTNVIRRHGSVRGISHSVIVIRESLWPAVYEDASRRVARESSGYRANELNRYSRVAASVTNGLTHSPFAPDIRSTSRHEYKSKLGHLHQTVAEGAGNKKKTVPYITGRNQGAG